MEFVYLGKNYFTIYSIMEVGYKRETRSSNTRVCIACIHEFSSLSCAGVESIESRGCDLMVPFIALETGNLQREKREKKNFCT